jgi:hypothetical protein
MRLSILSQIFGILAVGLVAGCMSPAGPVEITEEVAKAASAGKDTLPCFTQDGSFARHVNLSELNEHGYMVYPARQIVGAIPITNHRDEVIALQDYHGSQCMTEDAILGQHISFFPLRAVFAAANAIIASGI